ncbi:related to Pyruvate decarboxylase [Phialocephala subalpina]|uniref:Pyruvate decarboxylase n=1 Tax=Phialocephala subalpina TaxID=576137 RepID=A0A1L7WHS1_9HELO|nr:related to Pyruvate decarboxylase [Phialocephala subalpina]
MSPSVKLVEYLFIRLHQLGIRALHGVPGDFNLIALDYVEKCGLEWVGNANELNAGYAADGYARIKGIGAVLTTFGVGELSLANAIGGSRAENVSVVHINGAPSTKVQKSKASIHHSFGNGDFKVFERVFQELTVAHTDLSDPETAPAEIDRVLRECWIQSRPIYINLPTDMVEKAVDGSGLKTPLDLSYPVNDVEEEGLVTARILKRLYAAQKPVLILDGCIRRARLEHEVDTLVTKSNIPTFVTPMSKGIINKTYPNFGGLYSGSGSFDSVRSYVESSDCVLSIGSFNSDFNTTGFTTKLATDKLIDMHTDTVSVGQTTYNVHMRGVINSLLSQLDSSQLKVSTEALQLSRTRANVPSPLENYPESVITHEYLWEKLSDWLKPNDILVTETGTSYLGVQDTLLPSHTTCISQTLWSSIGYALPAAQGAAIAARELFSSSSSTPTSASSTSSRRTILFEGDGSFQLTTQSISDMIRHKLDVIEDESFANSKGLRFVEVKMPMNDAPITLKKLGIAAAAANAS